jgi:hypothetical protein
MDGYFNFGMHERGFISQHFKGDIETVISKLFFRIFYRKIFWTDYEYTHDDNVGCGFYEKPSILVWKSIREVRFSF